MGSSSNQTVNKPLLLNITTFKSTNEMNKQVVAFGFCLLLVTLCASANSVAVKKPPTDDGASLATSGSEQLLPGQDLGCKDFYVPCTTQEECCSGYCTMYRCD